MGRSGKTGNFIMFFSYLSVGVITQIALYNIVAMPTRDDTVRDKMGVAAVLCLYFELFQWDTIVMPVVLAVCASCSEFATRFFKCLSNPVPCFFCK
jgi:hypothetical protein